MISSTELDAQEKLIFEVDVSQVVSATKEVFSQKGWEILYEGRELPKKDYSLLSNVEWDGGVFGPIPLFFATSYDRTAWNEVLRSSNLEPKHFITGKTPTSGWSSGAELFIIVFESPKSGSVVSIAISTSQLLEKNKLETYLDEYVEFLNNYID